MLRNRKMQRYEAQLQKQLCCSQTRSLMVSDFWHVLAPPKHKTGPWGLACRAEDGREKSYDGLFHSYCGRCYWLSQTPHPRLPPSLPSSKTESQLCTQKLRIGICSLCPLQLGGTQDRVLTEGCKWEHLLEVSGTFLFLPFYLCFHSIAWNLDLMGQEERVSPWRWWKGSWKDQNAWGLCRLTTAKPVLAACWTTGTWRRNKLLFQISHWHLGFIVPCSQIQSKLVYSCNQTGLLITLPLPVFPSLLCQIWSEDWEERMYNHTDCIWGRGEVEEDSQRNILQETDLAPRVSFLCPVFGANIPAGRHPDECCHAFGDYPTWSLL